MTSDTPQVKVDPLLTEHIESYRDRYIEQSKIQVQKLIEKYDGEEKKKLLPPRSEVKAKQQLNEYKRVKN